MNNVLKNMFSGIVGLIIGATVVGLNKSNSLTSIETVLANTTQNPVSWNVVDVDNDGHADELITPHRNRIYGHKGPIYSNFDYLEPNTHTIEGGYILSIADKLIEYKNEFSKVAGAKKEFYWLCRVDDFNKDGVADKISWPRMGDKMPEYNSPLLDMQEKANKIIMYENQIQAYIANNR